MQNGTGNVLHLVFFPSISLRGVPSPDHFFDKEVVQTISTMRKLQPCLEVIVKESCKYFSEDFIRFPTFL